MKRVLLVTSKKLEDVVRSMLKPPEGYEVHVWGLPVDVVALLRPKSLTELLKREERLRGVPLRSFDYVLVSGMIPGDVSAVGEELGVKVYKGTKTLSELSLLISKLNEIEDKLSPREPVDEALEKFKLEELKKDLFFEYEEALRIGDLKLPLRSPPAFLAAEVLDNEDLEAQLSKASEVADMVIIGSTSTAPDPNKAKRLVKLAEKYFNTIGFDSMFVSELKSVNADLYLSLDYSKLEEFKGEKDKAFVVIPGNLKEGYWPSRAEEKVESLVRNLKIAESLGLEKLIVDPVLSPFPNLLESLVAFREVSRSVQRPMMMGISNFVELVDADTPGQVATLSALAVEAGVSLLMVTEHSEKCRGAWAEAKVAITMSSVAKKRSSQIKDLGLDLLILKEKRIKREQLKPARKKLEVRDHEFPLESTVVRIWVEGDKVRALVEPNGVWLEGDPYLMGKTLIAEGLVKEPSHALYLGWELHKAFIAAKLDKSYIQEMPLKFETAKEKLEKAGLLSKRGRSVEG